MDFTKLTATEHRLLTVHAELRAVDEILAHKHSMHEQEVKKWEAHREKLASEAFELEILSDDKSDVG